MAAMNPTVEMSYLFGRRLHLGDDLHVREDNHSRREQEAEEEDAQDEHLAPTGSLGQPPVQGARGSEGFGCIVPQAHQGHGGPEGGVCPDECQADVSMLSLQPDPWRWGKKALPHGTCQTPVYLPWTSQIPSPKIHSTEFWETWTDNWSLGESEVKGGKVPELEPLSRRMQFEENSRGQFSLGT